MKIEVDDSDRSLKAISTSGATESFSLQSEGEMTKDRKNGDKICFRREVLDEARNYDPCLSD